MENLNKSTSVKLPRLSKLAEVAFYAGTIPVIPIILAPMPTFWISIPLSIFALVALRDNPNVRGRVLAWAGLVFGLLGSIPSFFYVNSTVYFFIPFLSLALLFIFRKHPDLKGYAWKLALPIVVIFAPIVCFILGSIILISL